MNYKLLFLLFFATLTVSAQEGLVLRGDCTPISEDEAAAAKGMTPLRLPNPNTQWDADKTYSQLVILFSFSDTDFNFDNPQQVYDNMLNAKGYNQRQGKGCVADYYREQSGGLLNLQFDVLGPVTISTVAQPYASPNSNTRNYGREQFREATNMILAAYPDLDYSIYDWNGDGFIEQVVYIYAGYSGNQNSQKCYGHIWPNTSSFSAITTPDGKRISNYTASGELWSNNLSCGIGTICHEFTHSLGLPDIYPTNPNAGYSAVDEWDLMDGGNFTNYGWCPPNFSALEKMLMGWLTPVELSGPATILNMKPVSQGGEVYQIKHTNNEYLLLENRQWDGWDAGLPGKGLAVFHVNYNRSAWSGNTVNNTEGKYKYHLFNADNIDSYEEWQNLLIARGVTTQNGTYQNSNRMNRWVFSSASYPWTTDSTDVFLDSLTNESVPATLMYNDKNGSKFLSKPITRIRQNADGTLSFRFMGGVRMKGDMDDDDHFTIADIVAVTNVIALGGNDEQWEIADVNSDGKVNVADIIFLQMMMARTTLPVGDEETNDSYKSSVTAR